MISESRDNRLPNFQSYAIIGSLTFDFRVSYIFFLRQFWFALWSLRWSVWFFYLIQTFSLVSSVTSPLNVDPIISKCILSIVSFIERLTYTFEYWLQFHLFASRINCSSRYFLSSLSSTFLLFCSHQHKFAFYAGLPSLLSSLHHIGDHFNMITRSYLYFELTI